MRSKTAAACRLRVSARKDGRNLWLFVKNAEHRSPKTAPSAQLAVRPVAAQAQPTRIPEQPAAQPQAPEQQPQPPVYPQQPVYQQPVYPPQPAYDPADHTAEFDPEDVSQNKVIAMAAYILGTVGIIIALLAAPQSKYAAFHSRQALKLDIVSTLLLIVSAVLAFTFIVPIAGAVCIAILFVVRIVCFFQVCSGKAKDAAIIGKLPFLK